MEFKWNGKCGIGKSLNVSFIVSALDIHIFAFRESFVSFTFPIEDEYTVWVSKVNHK